MLLNYWGRCIGQKNITKVKVKNGKSLKSWWQFRGERFTVSSPTGCLRMLYKFRISPFLRNSAKREWQLASCVGFTKLLWHNQLVGRCSKQLCKQGILQFSKKWVSRLFKLKLQKILKVALVQLFTWWVWISMCSRLRITHMSPLPVNRHTKTIQQCPLSERMTINKANYSVCHECEVWGQSKNSTACIQPEQR